MTTNPGGVVDPDDLIGHSEELARLQRSIETGGAKLLGDRRMGKTSLLRLLEQTLREAGHLVVRVSAETDDPAASGRNLAEAMREAECCDRDVGALAGGARWRADHQCRCRRG